jgi:hypothetical protein
LEKKREKEHTSMTSNPIAPDMRLLKLEKELPTPA